MTKLIPYTINLTPANLAQFQSMGDAKWLEGYLTTQKARDTNILRMLDAGVRRRAIAGAHKIALKTITRIENDRAIRTRWVEIGGKK